MKIRPEMELLLCCSRMQVDAPTAARILSLLDAQIDWTYLIEWTLWHQVTPLLYRTLREVARDFVPDDILSALAIHVDSAHERSKMLMSELIEIIRLLEETGINIVPFKGPVIALNIYGGLQWRVFRDMDFLIHEYDLTRVLELLQARGYTSNHKLTPSQEKGFLRYSGQKIMFSKDGKVAIEPHWAFTHRMLAIDLNYQGLWQRVTKANIGGQKINTLSPEDTLFILCIHGSKEQWTRLKWICDVAEFMRNNQHLDWGNLCSRARAQGCYRMLMLGIALANKLLDSPIPGTLKKDIIDDGMITVLMEEACQYVTSIQLGTPDIVRFTRFRFRMRERIQDKIRYTVRTLTIPSVRHYKLVTLPDAFFWGYYPIRWIYDYLLIPLWIRANRVLRRFGWQLRTHD